MYADSCGTDIGHKTFQPMYRQSMGPSSFWVLGICSVPLSSLKNFDDLLAQPRECASGHLLSLGQDNVLLANFLM
jgi:hypothetical protein